MMNKRSVLASVLALIMLILSIPLSASAMDTEDSAEGFEYLIDEDAGEVEVTGYAGNKAVLVIPNTIEGLPVTKIGYRAFYRNEMITHITVPESVKSIGTGAMAMCWYLESVKLSYGLENIGAGAFRNNSFLSEVNIPESVTYIGENAFYGCSSLKSIHIPATVQKIEPSTEELGMLSGCRSLESVTVDKGNEYYYSINNCIIDKATNIIIAGAVCSTIPRDERITNIGSYAFSECYGLTDVVISGNITTLSDYSFADCYNLKKVTLLDGVSSIGQYAFREAGIETLRLTSSVKSIERAAFYKCSISTVYFEGTPEEWTKIAVGTSNDAIFKANIVFVGNGDIDGDGELSSADALLLRMYFSSIITVNDIDAPSADLNGDGVVNSKDILLLRKKLAG
ncbi:MAG: leucine-rich repeat protein [Clostridia bacterium]|nr:leucine-rich repeat protein [Clostridia bacterium]